MSGWLEDALAGYLATVTEREFDGPFIAYLRSSGFEDIHQLHGAYEFGKDFIAKRDGCQWAFQSKAGDINMAAWRIVRSQVEEMVWNDIAHPNFDLGLPRRPVLVTTGRLIGGAAAEAQQYAIKLVERSRPSSNDAPDARPTAFDVWDRETLVAGLAVSPETSLDAWGEEPLRELLGTLADVERRQVTVQNIERSSRHWPHDDLMRVGLAAGILGQRLIETNRADLACMTAYALVRTSAVGMSPQDAGTAQVAMEIARSLFDAYATELIDNIRPLVSDARELFTRNTDLLGAVTYPVRCLTTIEVLGMKGLLHRERSEDGEAAEVAQLLASFVADQPGASHPISDRWAVSLIPAAILLHGEHRDLLVSWLGQVAAWICDRYEDGDGLASPAASPDEEVAQLLGPPYEHVGIQRRTGSYLATVVLDLASTLELADLYDDAFNDFSAVGIALPSIEPLDEPGQYLHAESGVVAEANISFDEVGDGDGWQKAVHHRRAPESYELDRMTLSWELLAVTLLLRNRHFLTTTRRLARLDP